MDHDDNSAFVREFIVAFPRATAEELGAFFTDDAVYHDAPAAPVLGRPAIIDRLRRVFAQVEPLPWEVRALASCGTAVLTERIDHFRMGSRRVSGATMGTFELRAGKIAAWREYWDAGLAARQARGESPPPDAVSENALSNHESRPREESDNIALVRRFVADFQGANAEHLAGYFADAAVYHDLPWDPCRGRAAIPERLRGFFARSEQLP